MALTLRPARATQLALLAVAGYYALWGGEYSAFSLRRLEQRHAVEVERLSTLRQQVDSLRAVAGSLERDDRAIERVARERFGMVRQGERLYRFVPVGPES